jgi:hypothetical protein
MIYLNMSQGPHTHSEGSSLCWETEQIVLRKSRMLLQSTRE